MKHRTDHLNEFFDPSKPDKLLLRGECSVTKRMWELEVDLESYKKWRNGEYIQVAFADLPAEKRELMLTGITGEGWDLLFPKDDEDGE